MTFPHLRMSNDCAQAGNAHLWAHGNGGRHRLHPCKRIERLEFVGCQPPLGNRPLNIYNTVKPARLLRAYFPVKVGLQSRSESCIVFGEQSTGNHGQCISPIAELVTCRLSKDTVHPPLSGPTPTVILSHCTFRHTLSHYIFQFLESCRRRIALHPLKRPCSTYIFSSSKGCRTSMGHF